MRYRILAARVRLDEDTSIAEYEERMNQLLEDGYMPWGMPGVALVGPDTVIVQHMTKEDEDEIEGSDSPFPDDMG